MANLPECNQNVTSAKLIVPAVKVKLTAGRIESFQCEEGKAQSFLWCEEVKGLGIRATAGSTRKSYIFQSKFRTKSLRITIGDVDVWSIETAQKEARRLQVTIDSGLDPRKVRADQDAAKEAEAAAQKQQEARDTVTLGMAWDEYLAARKPFWGSRHYDDHIDSMQKGGETRKRSKKLTQPGALASLATVRLVDLTPELIAEWAKVEGKMRPARARLAHRLLTIFFTWCAASTAYRDLVKSNPAKSKTTREILGKAQKKNDALQREQLPAWFAAVRKLDKPVLSAYLQALLLTGARTNELTGLRWENVNFQWGSMTIRDKMEGERTIPLTPYLAQLLGALPRRNAYVFSSLGAASGHLTDPHSANYRVCAVTGIDVTLHGLRRSFATLCEWIEMPGGIAAQIQGHAPQGVREQNYIRRPLDLLRMWHIKIEAWILEQAGIEFVPTQEGLRLVKGNTAA